MDMQRQARIAVGEAQNDDATFSGIFDGAKELSGVPIGLSDIERALLVIRELLKQGFVPVTTGYQVPSGVPWEEKTETDILARIQREFDQLTHEPMFLDICWFNLPRA